MLRSTLALDRRRGEIVPVPFLLIIRMVVTLTPTQSNNFPYRPSYWPIYFISTRTIILPNAPIKQLLEQNIDRISRREGSNRI
ncbi:hypothetical protein J3F84DRAFT_387804 [Trichoderma pleuroticola]